MKGTKHLPEVIVVALSGEHEEMIGICIFKGEYKEERNKEGGGRRGKTLAMCMHRRTTRLYTVQRTARSLRVSLWAKLHLLIEMRESKKEKILDGEKRKRKAECSGGNDHTLIHCVTWVSREETESAPVLQKD